jgi:hypothetical protein
MREESEKVLVSSSVPAYGPADTDCADKKSIFLHCGSRFVLISRLRAWDLFIGPVKTKSDTGPLDLVYFDAVPALWDFNLFSMSIVTPQ